MTLDLSFFNIGAILVCTLINMVLGSLWYSPLLFGKTWMKLMDIQAQDISRNEGNKAMAFAIIPALLNTLILSMILAFVGAQTIPDALGMSALLSLGLVGMSKMNLVIFENRKLGLVLIHLGYTFVGFLVSGIILVLWR
ncbi:MAG: DUF1761 domain-containing protein [Spirochaetales bacterium]|nr:DUF1761 domain-containing protein [Spirochaetales bacterium]